jgi:hypothetical protein
MNSRGRPLTEFETVKARLGQTIAHTGRREELGRKIDGAGPISCGRTAVTTTSSTTSS